MGSSSLKPRSAPIRRSLGCTALKISSGRCVVLRGHLLLISRSAALRINIGKCMRARYEVHEMSATPPGLFMTYTDSGNALLDLVARADAPAVARIMRSARLLD